jgi:hypothetical protein
MIINDDPSPMERLGDQTCKIMGMCMRVYARLQIKHIVRIFIGGVILTSAGFYTQSVSQAQVLVTDDVVTERVQDYNACVFRKQLHADQTAPALNLDPECVEESVPEDQVAIARKEHMRSILANHPMESMIDILAEQDEAVAAFMIGIAKQESNWGKRSPWKAGQDCYNYWGYKTSGSRGQALGHACFGSPEEAVETVGKRIAHFIYDTGRDTAQKMLVWKCGSSCAGHSPEGVARWVGTVQKYSERVLAISPQTNDQLFLSRN